MQIICLTNFLLSLVANHYFLLLGTAKTQKAVEGDFVGAYATEASPAAPERHTSPETLDNLDTGAYDLKYDVEEFDLGEADSKLYDYGLYDEYGVDPSKPTAAYDNGVGLGVAAETDDSESTVSIPS